MGRLLTTREIETMIAEVEQDDMLAVYTAGSVLGDVAEVLSDVQAASRRLPNVSQDQLIRMLEDLPRSAAGEVSFNDVQARILRARMQRVDELRKMYPDVLARRDPDVARLGYASPPKPFGQGTLAVRIAEEAALGESIQTSAAATGGLGSFRAHVGARDASAKARASARRGRGGLPSPPKLGRMTGEAATASADPPPLAGAAAAAVGAGTAGNTLFPRTASLFAAPPKAAALAPLHGHPKVAPKGGLDASKKKMGEVERFRVLETMLHQNLTLVADIDTAMSCGASKSARASSLIMRPDVPSAADKWKRFAPLAIHRHGGTNVPGALTRSEMQQSVLK
jgi:hypothetical protein